MTNHDWLTRSKAAVWHPCTQMKRHETFPLVPIARGQGPWLYDFEGNKYLDAVSSWWTNLFGHCHPEINRAIKDQLDQLEHVMLAGFTHEPVVTLSERLSAKTDHHLGHAFYGSDGASATEIALKMSFHYWRNHGHSEKQHFISLQNSYHGETLGALSVTDVALFKDTYAPLLRHSTQVLSPDARLDPDGDDEAQALRAAAALEQHLAQHHQQTAALILEPMVQGAAGMAMYHPSYLKRARALCSQYHVHLIADEIAMGFGRTGTFFACQHGDIWPDLMCLSKGITGGYLPLSAVLVTDQIYQAFYHDDVSRGFLHSHSYTGNPLACRAALATLDVFEHTQALHANQRTAQLINTHLAPYRDAHWMENLRHLGMIWAFEVKNAPADFARQVFSSGLRHGILLRPMGNTVYWMPPYVLDEGDSRHLVQASIAAISKVLT